MLEAIKLLQPYFGLSKDKLGHTIAAVLMLIGNIAIIFLQAALNSCAFGLIGVIQAEGFNYLMLRSQAIMIAGYCLGVGASYAMTSVVSTWLRESLISSLRRNYVAKWMGSNAFYGVPLTNPNSSKIPGPDGINKDIQTITAESIRVSDYAIMTALTFVSSAFNLVQLSIPVTISILGITVTIPGFMFIGALLYSYAYSSIIDYFNTKLHQSTSDLRAAQDNTSAHLQYISQNGESIAMRAGAEHEVKILEENINKETSATGYSTVYSAIISLAQQIHYSASFSIGLLLALPSVLSGKIPAEKLFIVSNNFTNIVGLFSWRSNIAKQSSLLSVAAERINCFNTATENWIELQKQKKLTVSSSTAIKLTEITVTIPNPENSEQKTIFKNVNVQFPEHQATLISGPSGIGKTTLFRVIAGLWPSVEGSVEKPARAFMIPQQGFIPFRGSILDAINYPNIDNKDTDIENINKLMKDLSFEQDIIERLQVADSCANLSGGQKQRVTILGAIIAKPELLLIDEGFNGLDEKTRLIVEQVIKRELPNTTIIAIDHAPLKAAAGQTPFYDKCLEIAKVDEPHNDGKLITLGNMPTS